jgi:hypothetical protein
MVRQLQNDPTPHLLDFARYPTQAECDTFYAVHLQTNESEVSKVDLDTIDALVRAWCLACHAMWAL